VGASRELARLNAGGDVTVTGHAQDAAAARLSSLGWSPAEIGDHLGIEGDETEVEHYVVMAVKRAIADWVVWSRDERRVMQVVTLEAMKRQLWRALDEIRMFVVSNGRMILDLEGEPLEDWRFKLEVVDRLIKVEEQIAKLTGTYAPRESVTITRDNVEEEILRLEKQLSASGAKPPVAKADG
jgi:hypothetical protein